MRVRARRRPRNGGCDCSPASACASRCFAARRACESTSLRFLRPRTPSRCTTGSSRPDANQIDAHPHPLRHRRTPPRPAHPALADEPPAPPPPASPTPPAPVQPAAVRQRLLRRRPSRRAPPSRPRRPSRCPPFPGTRGTSSSARTGASSSRATAAAGRGASANIVAHGDRIDEDSYAELELRREDQLHTDVSSKVVCDARLLPALLPLLRRRRRRRSPSATSTRRRTYDDLTLWVGSRMYRGDDIYLLDWWPLDNQNTVGGGAGYKFRWAHRRDDHRRARGDAAARLDLPVRADPARPTPQRARRAGRAGRRERHGPRPPAHDRVAQDHAPLQAPQPGAEGRLQARPLRRGARDLRRRLHRHHRQPAGADRAARPTPGWLVGHRGRVLDRASATPSCSSSSGTPRASRPTTRSPCRSTFANDRTTRGFDRDARSPSAATTSAGPFGVLVGGYLRSFRDGDPSPTTSQKYDEGILAVRPQLYIGERWGVALEGAFEARRYAVLDPQTDAAARRPASGASASSRTSRPAAAARTSARSCGSSTRSPPATTATRELYPAQDVFSQRRVEQYIGLGAEWWFNSSSYP